MADEILGAVVCPQFVRSRSNSVCMKKRRTDLEAALVLASWCQWLLLYVLNSKVMLADECSFNTNERYAIERPTVIVEWNVRSK